MIHPCDKPCGNKSASGYCATTACINPQYSNIGTAHYGQGVQKRIVTNADCIRAMTDEELRNFLVRTMTCTACSNMHGGKCPKRYKTEKCGDMILDWLKQEAAFDG